MRKIIKRAGMIFLTGIMCFSVSGCGHKSTSQKVGRASDLNFKSIDYDSVSDLEQANYIQDAKMFKKINKLSVYNQKDATTSKERSVIILKYLEDIYKLASARTSTDMDNLYVYSKDYQKYIAVLQSYCEYYGRDIKDIKNHIQDENFNQKDEPTFVVLGQLEDFWTDILEQIDK